MEQEQVNIVCGWSATCHNLPTCTSLSWQNEHAYCHTAGISSALPQSWNCGPLSKHGSINFPAPLTKFDGFPSGKNCLQITWCSWDVFEKVCSSTFANDSVCHSMLWCFVSAMHWNTQDSSPITKQMRTCGTVRQMWLRLHNLSCSAPEVYPWDCVEQTSCRSPSFQYLQASIMDSLLVKVQLILQQKWRPHMGVWPPV